MIFLIEGGIIGLFRSWIKIFFVVVVGFDDGWMILFFIDYDVCVCDCNCIWYDML